MGKTWVPLNSFLLKSHFNSVNQLFLSEFLYKTMLSYVTFLWRYFCWFMFKIFLFLEIYIDRMVDDDFQKNLEFDEKGVETESSVFVESKYQYISGENSFGAVEKPEAKNFTIQEMFVNVNEEDKEEAVIVEEVDNCFEEKLFHFSFFKNGIFQQENVQKAEVFDEKIANDQENDEVLSENLEDICYEIEFFPKNQSLVRNSIRWSDTIEVEDVMTSDKSSFDRHLNGFLNDVEENDDMGFIELEPPLKNFSVIKTNDFVSKDVDTVEEDDVSCVEMKLVDDLEEFSDHNSSRKSCEIGEFASKIVDRVEETDVDCEEMQFVEDLKEFSDDNSRQKSWDIGEFVSKNVDIIEEEDATCVEMELIYDLQESPEHSLSRKSFDTHEFATEKVDRDNEEDVNCVEMKLMDDFQEFPDHISSRKSCDTDEFDAKKVDTIEENDVNCDEMKLLDDIQESPEYNSSRKSWDSDEDSDEDEFDILLEHQNLVKQMKMEMRNSRIAGLPTISEESESFKVVEDLKPLKIDEKIEYKDCMEEIQKFYKSYAEKMKKLDILNYQTLNAISFLQLKDSEVFASSKKSSISITKAFTLPSFLANKQRKIFADPALKSISEMNRDLEIVYVGQVCLSWEILCWQYGKTKESLEHDRHEYHSYNHVAGEYQQFQVLLQRFVEDEPFQGPRVQSYVRKRCIVRSFLQVPNIRDDRLKEKQGIYSGEKDFITIVKLAEIINETMHVFWEFLRTDKSEANFALKGVQGTQMDNAELELLMDVKSNLQKKEKKLKDVQRSGNCIVKKFQKQHEGRLSRSLFASLVELKLVSRVLSLPRLKRDHLVWCQKKLSNINVSGRKVSMEQSFSLFPC